MTPDIKIWELCDGMQVYVELDCCFSEGRILSVFTDEDCLPLVSHFGRVHRWKIAREQVNKVFEIKQLAYKVLVGHRIDANDFGDIISRFTPDALQALEEIGRILA